MKANPCKVCGGTDMNLVAGFYYCVECGTQDENVQESVVEQVILADGTAARQNVKKIVTKKDTVEMSAEWYKWHAYNFIIAGLTEELIAAGAKPSVRSKILWIWTRYIKKFQVKDSGPVSEFYSNGNKENLDSSEPENNENGQQRLSNNNNHHKDTPGSPRDLCKDLCSSPNEHLQKDECNLLNNNKQCSNNNLCDGDQGPSTDNDNEYIDSDDEIYDKVDSEENSDTEDECNDKNDETVMMKGKGRINFMSKGVLIAILYIALNLDRSDIQLSHLKRLIKCGYINISECTKYIPKDLNVKKIPHFGGFKISLIHEYSTISICVIVRNLFKCLDLGLPLVPNIRKIIDDYIKELCLPNDFKDLVESLMFQYPCHYFKVSQLIDELTFIPDYETTCMAYVMVALKMCFGLDSDYEIRLSEIVEKINKENNYPKSYKLGPYSESTQRLFSFKEWCGYMRTRKMIMCKHNLLMANLCRSDIDDYVFLEHLEERNKNPMTLGQEIMMDIINKISLENKVSVIPKTEFELTFTPMTTVTNVILDYIQDPDLRLILSEDFTQYSLEYAIKFLQLKENEKAQNIIKGVSDDNKIMNKNQESAGSLYVSKFKGEGNISVYVRFCEDKGSIKLTNDETVPTSKDKTKENHDSKLESTKDDIENNKDSDSDTDSSKLVFTNERTIKFVDYPNACIYDEDNKADVKQAIEQVCESAGDNESLMDQSHDILDQSLNINQSSQSNQNLPTNFNRKDIIDELIMIACKKYNLKLPEKTRKVLKPPKKRNPLDKPQRKKKKEEAIGYNLLTLYYKTLENNLSNRQNNSLNLTGTDSIVQSDSIINNESTIRDDLPIQSTDLNNDLNQSDVMDTSELEILESNEIEDEECFLNADDDSDDDYTFPPIIDDSDVLENGQSMSQLNKVINKILSNETKQCEEPPKKKFKKSANRKKKTASDGEKIFCGNERDLKEFNYWILWYNNLRIHNMHLPFNCELYEHCPHSFSYVLHQCALVIDCSPSRLYKAMQHIEKYMARDLNCYNNRWFT